MRRRLSGPFVGTFLAALAAAGPFALARQDAAAPVRWGQAVLPSGRTLLVEIADTPAKHQRGYMFREQVSETEGMVFLMQGVDFHPFWMKNCKVALDIVWMDEGWRVVHIERSVPPCKEGAPCPGYLPMQAAIYVLETQAGLTGREGLKLGDHIIFMPPEGRASPGTPPDGH